MSFPSVFGPVGLGGFIPPILQDADSQLAFEIGFNIKDAITAAEAGLSVVNDVVEFDPGPAIAAGLSEVDAVSAGFVVGHLNQEVAAGRLQIEPGSTGWQTVTSVSPFYWTGTLVKSFASGEYRLTVESTWYGYKITLNKALSRLLIDLINVGGCATALAAAICAALGLTNPPVLVAAAILAIVTAALLLGAAILNAMERCNGIAIRIFGGIAGGLPVPGPA